MRVALVAWLLALACARPAAVALPDERHATEGPAETRAPVAGELPDDPVAAHVARLEAYPEVAATRVGVLLPLSGTYGRLGREALDAVKLAAADVEGVELIVADTKGEADVAVAELERLAREGVVMVLGPIGAREAAAVAVRGAQLLVPVALLSPAEGIAHGPSGVVRLVTTGEEQARAAARHAHARGFGVPAVLAPRDDQGLAEAAAFTAECARLGIPVVASGSYDATGVGLEADVKRFLGLDARANPRYRQWLARHKSGAAFSPEVGFDLLFVPDGAEQAALVASYLVYYNVELRTPEPKDPYMLRRKHGGRIPQLVQLMGGPGWHHPALIERGAEAVHGALLVDVFVGGREAQVSWPGAMAFVDAFVERHEREPSRLAAEAHDAARIAFAAWRVGMRDPQPRRGVARALERGGLTDGACGPARVGVGGSIERGSILLMVDGTDFVVL